MKTEIFKNIDEMFELMLPFENHETVWAEHTELLKVITLFEDIADGIERERYPRSEKEYNDPASFTNIRQRLNVYHAFAAYIYGEEYKGCFETALSDTEKNVEHLLELDDPEKALELEGSRLDMYYIPDLCYWTEPLSWIAYESYSVGSFLGMTDYIENFLDVYGRYIGFLRGKHKSSADTAGLHVVRFLLDDAEKKYREMDEYLSMKLADDEEFERMYEDEEPRRGYKSFAPDTYHKQNKKFTKKLKKLIRDNPTLPVIVLSGIEHSGTKLTCSVCYLYGRDCVEKVIAISPQDRGPMDPDLPF